MTVLKGNLEVDFKNWVIQIDYVLGINALLKLVNVKMNSASE